MNVKKIVLLMGAESDLPHAQKIAATIKDFGVETVFRIASAHRTPEKLLHAIKEEEKNGAGAFIVVAGLSNALSGVAACATTKPVITCPPDDKDLLSSLLMPSGVAHAVVINPKNAALHALRSLALTDKALDKKLENFLAGGRNKIEDADAKARRL